MEIIDYDTLEYIPLEEQVFIPWIDDYYTVEERNNILNKYRINQECQNDLEFQRTQSN